MTAYAPPPKQKQDVDKQLDSISKYIEMVQNSINEGQTINIQGLENTIATLCQDIETLSSDKAKPLATRIQSLIEQLNILETTLKKKSHT